ncbi:MAG: SPOR domain-containing protein [Myxococcales bacterium]|nr:SPOR domain-containing protein [Myxococcales bacterium]
MDNDFRDLDQLHERDEDTTLRRLSLMAMGAFAVVAVIFATGVVVVQGVDRKPNADYDPLEQLLDSGEFSEKSDSPAASAAADDTVVDREGLMFPEALKEPESRAEVEAQVAAAAAEVSHPDPVVDVASLEETLPRDRPTLSAETASGHSEQDSAVASPKTQLSRAAGAKTGATKPKGRYGIQVISYSRADQANRYAEVLKSRGHAAYVLSHHAPGKETYWRVRVGPFADQAAAEAYRTRLERDEQLKTLVVQSND